MLNKASLHSRTDSLIPPPGPKKTQPFPYVALVLSERWVVESDLLPIIPIPMPP